MVSPSRLPRLQAYYSSRNAAATNTSDGHAGPWSCQPLNKRLWSNSPGKAVEVRPFPDSWSFQPQPFRRTAHPYEKTRFYKAPNPQDVKTGGSPWFGYPQQRWKNHWLPEYEETVTTPEPSLEEIRHFLTQKFGTLTVAFNHLDFVKNGRISAIEWSEGLFNLICGGHADHPVAYQLAKVPRWLFNERMQKLFYEMDTNKDGEIGYKEFAHAQGHPVDNAHEFTSRRMLAKKIELSRGKVKPPPEPALHASSYDSSDQVSEPSDREELTEKNALDNRMATTVGEGFMSTKQQMMRDFSAFLLFKFPNVEEAFKSFDVNKNGLLGAAEFEEGARYIGYDGPAKELFRHMDEDKSAQISIVEFKQLLRPSKKALACVAKRIRDRKKIKSKWVTPIKPPAALRRCISLPDLDITLPMGEKISTSYGFYAFERNPTRRLQLDFHPTEYRGQDSFNFRRTLGPGTYNLPKETGAIKHANRQACSKVGGNSMQHRCPRFQAPPTKEGKEDLKNLANAYCSYVDMAGPTCGVRVDQVGSTVNKVNKLGDTMGADNMPGLLAPTNEISSVLKMNRLDQDLRAQGASTLSQ
eukprot:GEMP01035379.1.p1 GENE.GEMP01035379.1~~GEMP01035379.1.p1  ORF type:complete len:594 (+),score=117.63 GEMP01035379.1:37-1782(+)